MSVIQEEASRDLRQGKLNFATLTSRALAGAEDDGQEEGMQGVDPGAG